MDRQDILLELKGISKRFPGVKALDNVSLTLKRGEVLGLVGENGAGKSTMIKIINGVTTRDSGEILLQGRRVEMRNPYEAKMVHKIAYVSQESTLCPDLTVAENIVLGNWKNGKSYIDWKKVNDFAKKVLEDLGLDISPKELLGNLRPADRQLVEIARALSMDSHILLLDEPTSWLSEGDRKFLFERIQLLKSKGVGVIFISHFLDEVLKISDRVQVIRDGKNVGVFNNDDLTKEILIEKMLGQSKVKHEEGTKAGITDKTVLKVRGVTKAGQVEDISFEVREGEILGITGLLGCGKSELARIIFGLEKPDRGEVSINGVKQRWKSPKASIDAGFAFITKDRKEEGIIPHLSIAKNITLARLKSVLLTKSVLNLKEETKVAKELINTMDIRPRNPEHVVVNLSGGNQQKVVISKWLQANSKVLILDEPTRGVDVGAKFEIYKLLREQARQGKAIIFISSELTEILEVPHRFLVFKKGKMAGEYKSGEIKDEHELLSILSA